jgi:hypothetical protein
MTLGGGIPGEWEIEPSLDTIHVNVILSLSLLGGGTKYSRMKGMSERVKKPYFRIICCYS